MICIIQVRYDSKRFKGKVLKKIQRKSIIEIIYNRLVNLKKLDYVVVATTRRKIDDKIYQFCKKKKLNFFRGSFRNLISRYISCSEFFACTKIVRITGDSPLVDKNLVSKMIEIYKKNSCDLVTNAFPRSYPKGITVEIFSINLLKKISKKKLSVYEREHLTSYIYNNSKEFKIINCKNSKNLSNINLSVDTKKDLNKIKKIIKKLKKKIYFVNYKNFIKYYE